MGQEVGAGVVRFGSAIEIEFYGAEAMGVRYVGVEGSDINGGKDGIWGQWWEGADFLEEVVGVTEVGGQSFHKRLEMGVNKG